MDCRAENNAFIKALFFISAFVLALSSLSSASYALGGYSVSDYGTIEVTVPAATLQTGATTSIGQTFVKLVPSRGYFQLENWFTPGEIYVQMPAYYSQFSAASAPFLYKDSDGYYKAVYGKIALGAAGALGTIGHFSMEITNDYTSTTISLGGAGTAVGRFLKIKPVAGVLINEKNGSLASEAWVLYDSGGGNYPPGQVFLKDAGSDFFRLSATNALTYARDAVPACPEVLCKLYCPAGKAVDQNGCQKCECLPGPDIGGLCGGIAGIKCNTGLTCKLDGAYPDASGKCVLQEPTPYPCPTMRCMLYCPSGNAVDENGCAKCECNPPQGELGGLCGGIAAIKCKLGLACKLDGAYPDASGKCVLQEPTPLPCPQIAPCASGIAKCAADANGCKVCECVNPTPTPFQCPLQGCRWYKNCTVDANGCQKCECLTGPDIGGLCGGIAGIKCNTGLTCKIDVTYPDASGKCVLQEPTPYPCPTMRCMLYCPSGNELDENGCAACKCKPTPRLLISSVWSEPQGGGTLLLAKVLQGNDAAPSSATVVTAVVYLPSGKTLSATMYFDESRRYYAYNISADEKAGYAKAVVQASAPGLLPATKSEEIKIHGPIATPFPCPQFAPCAWGIAKCALDEKGCSKCECNEPEITPVPSEGFLAYLQKGWNLFSTPVATKGHAKISSTTCGGFTRPLCTAGGLCTDVLIPTAPTVWHYNALAGKFEKAGQLREGQSLPAQQGFWVKVDRDYCNVTFSGSEKVSMDGAKLYEGWNQIGAPYGDALWPDVSQNCKVLRGPYWYSPLDGKYSDSKYLTASFGYFVKVAGNCALGSSLSTADQIPSLPQ
ncbi:MAG: hypothetical protein WC792_01370 [Candidatus Micrarchaeia archaeon]